MEAWNGKKKGGVAGLGGGAPSKRGKKQSGNSGGCKKKKQKNRRFFHMHNILKKTWGITKRENKNNREGGGRNVFWWTETRANARKNLWGTPGRKQIEERGGKGPAPVESARTTKTVPFQTPKKKRGPKGEKMGGGGAPEELTGANLFKGGDP